MGSEWVVALVVSKHPPWSTATSTTTLPGFIAPSISRVTSFGAEAPGISTAPTRTSARPSAAMRLWWLLDSVVSIAVEDVVEPSHPIEVRFEDGHPGAETERHLGRIQADDSATEDDHVAWRHAGHAGKQGTPASHHALQVVGAHQDRHAARHLGHGRQERQAAVLVGDRLVGDSGDLALTQQLGQLRQRGQVQVGEESLTLAAADRTPARSAP